MKKSCCLLFLVLFVCGFTLGCSAEQGSGSISWLHSYEDAISKAKSEEKPLMIDIYTDWCGWCKKLDKDTFTDSKVIELSASFVCLKVDGDKSEELTKKYDVRGYPTIVFTDSDGNKIGGGAGFRSASKLASEMQAALKR